MAPRDIILYQEGSLKITPSWLINGASRYAIRTVVQLDFRETRQPRGRALFMLLTGLGLCLLSLRYVVAGATPAVIPYIMLGASLVLAAGSGWFLHSSRPRYRIDVVLRDGSRLPIVRTVRSKADAVLNALTRAMDWHRHDDVVAPARISRVRRGRARSPVQGQGHEQGRERVWEQGQEREREQGQGQDREQGQETEVRPQEVADLPDVQAQVRAVMTGPVVASEPAWSRFKAARRFLLLSLRNGMRNGKG